MQLPEPFHNRYPGPVESSSCSINRHFFAAMRSQVVKDVPFLGVKSLTDVRKQDVVLC